MARFSASLGARVNLGSARWSLHYDDGKERRLDKATDAHFCNP